jgi:hypothetical protein
MTNLNDLQRISDTVWELPTSYKEGMRVPARIYGSEKLMQELDDAVYDQVTNVATLPGITKYALCMPDGHFGYGFPIGGVAAMDVEEDLERHSMERLYKQPTSTRLKHNSVIAQTPLSKTIKRRVQK